MNFKQLAQDITEQIGGIENINQVRNCSTRLRFDLKNYSKVNEDKLKKIKGVAGVVNKGGQFQVIIGTEVSHVREEIEKLGTIVEEKTEEKKKGIINTVLDVICGSVTPVIPAFIGGGLLKAVLALLVLAGLSKNDQTYQIVNTIADAAFYYMPILVAYSASKKFNCNSVLSMTVAAMLLHPNLLAMKAAGKAVHFFGIPVVMATYSSSIIPAILEVWFLSYVERFAEKVTPKVIKVFAKPLMILAIVAPVTLIVLGPIGTIIGNGLTDVFVYLDSLGTWIVPTIIGFVYPLLVMTGMHWSLMPVFLQEISKLGYETLSGPGALASNTAQAAASLCVAVKSKNLEKKELASSVGFTALMGITEPAMFGITLTSKKILLCVMTGGGIGGLFAGITGLVRYAPGGASLPTLPLYIGANPKNIIYAVLTLIISFISTFVLTWIFGFKEEAQEKNVDMAVDKKINEELSAPVNGSVIPLSEVKDETFAGEMMGKGIAIYPEDGKVCSPVNGKIIFVSDTLHAVAIKSDIGSEILIHIGIDTVELKGEYFHSHIKMGDSVRKGDLLIEFNKKQIIEKGYDAVIPIIITNTNDYDNILVTDKKRVVIGDSILKLKR